MMKDEVIIVKSLKDIIRVIQKIVINELVFIDIDKNFFKDQEINVINSEEDSVTVDGYQFNLYKMENRDWYGLLHVTDSKGKSIYSVLSYNVLFWSEGKCEYHTVYIKKRGSKSKIDEG